MGKPLNWMLSGASANRVTSRILRKRLAFTTILAVSPFLGYGRSAYAACDPTGPATYSCSGTIPGAIIAIDNANVSTLATPPFVVTDDGLIVRGYGDIRFTDNNASSITNTGYGAGLSVVSHGDISEGADGAVTIITNGTITGQKGDGIYAYNGGSGDLSITANGEVTGMDSGEFSAASDGVYAVNYGNNLTITTGAQSAITGNDNAIDARNYGAGTLEITVQGKAKSYDYDGIFARNGDPWSGENEADDLKITVGAQAVVDGGGNGIQAQNYGGGNLDITVNGSVTGQGYDGLHAVNYGSNLIIATGASSKVVGNAEEGTDSNGIDARNYGSGYLKITADGTVFGNINDGIFAKNYGTDLTIETGAQSVIKGGGNGIGAYNHGSGNLSVQAEGVVGGFSEYGDGIHAFNSANGENLTITTGADSDVFGGKDGIDAYNHGSGFLSISADGQVTGEDGDGIRAINSLNGGSDEYGRSLTITTGADSTIRGTTDGIDGRNYGFGSLIITAQGEVTGENGDGIFARNVDKEIPYETADGRALGLTITTESASKVTGKYNGINAHDTGDGDFLITANGQVTGQIRDGIYGLDGSEGQTEIGGDFTIVTGASSIVSGNFNGINARNFGSGSLKIDVSGQVTGAEIDGIYAISDPYGDDNDLTIITRQGSVVSGGDDGIEAIQDGEGGAFKITVDGTVTGLGDDYCNDSKDSKDCKADPGDGIYANNYRGASTEIEIGGAGLVQGRATGIYARSGDGQFITITNDGIVRNLSELGSDLAIETYGGGSLIDNRGSLIGTLRLSGEFSDTLNNDGLWVTTGTSDFGDENDDVVNNRGTLFGAQDSKVLEAPVLYGQ
ncbi:MAG TPA: hypothetical protein VL101_09040, partial [Nordella sp.]|nr:hypothetical protein [Nordella sp.]